MTHLKPVNIASAFIIACKTAVFLSLVAIVSFGGLTAKKVEACAFQSGFGCGGFDYGCGFGGGGCGSGFGTGGYNFVQYPSLNYVYNQSPRQNAGSSYTFQEFPTLRYVYTQDPRPRPASENFQSTFTQFPYLRYVYFNNPNQTASRSSQTASVPRPAPSSAPIDWMSVYSNPTQYMSTAQPQYNTLGQFTVQPQHFFQPDHRSNSFGIANQGHFGGVNNGFTMTSGF